MRMLTNNLPAPSSSSENKTFDRWVNGQSILGHKGKVVFHAETNFGHTIIALLLLYTPA